MIFFSVGIRSPSKQRFNEDDTFGKGKDKSRMRSAQTIMLFLNQLRFKCDIRYIHDLVEWVKKWKY